MPEIISRKEAIALGLNRYFTGSACKNGHKAERYASSGHCITCMAIAGVTHAERGRQTRKRYKIRNKAKCSARARTYYIENRSKILQRMKDLRKQNPEKFRQRSKCRYAKNIETIRAKHSAYRQNNIERLRKLSRDRAKKIADLLAVLRSEMPDLLKEFEL